MLRIRFAKAEDAALLRTMIREFASFERELEMVSIQESDLVRDGFEENPRFRALIAEWETNTAGYALFFPYFSTWAGRALFLEDLFVREKFRGKGIGRELFATVARIAVEDKCYGMHWEVLDWNRNAIRFYESLGATFRDQWRSVALTDEPLRRLAGKAS